MPPPPLGAPDEPAPFLPAAPVAPPRLARPAPPRSEKKPGLSGEPQATSCARQAETKLPTEKPRTNFIAAPKKDARPRGGGPILVVTEWRSSQASRRENDAGARSTRRIFGCDLRPLFALMW